MIGQEVNHVTSSGGLGARYAFVADGEQERLTELERASREGLGRRQDVTFLVIYYIKYLANPGT